MSQKPSRGNAAKTILSILIAVMILATGLVVWLCIDMVNKTPEVSVRNDPVVLPTAPPPPPTTVPATTEPQPEHVVSRATFLSTGDLVMHVQLIDKAKNPAGYNFSPVFQYISPYVTKADYSLINLETTFGGEGFPYQGFPKFNCPDELAANAKAAGFDAFLTANNHSFDTGMDGFLRTLDVSRAAGLETLGTMKDGTEPKYLIKEFDGMRIGVLCYTYETSGANASTPSLNGNIMRGATFENLNSYNYLDPTRMYTELEQYLGEMKAADVDATILYIHWGPNEYETYAPATFKKIAQKLCDVGIDVIVGGHPHVVEPVDLLTSTVDENHKTVVLYSMGNAVSNQRLGNLQSVKTAHTEDGVLFSVTFCQYSDGSVHLESVELIPTWVNLADQYYILPLDPATESEWKTLYDLTDGAFNQAKGSYARTMKIVGEGMKKCQDWLKQQQEARDAYYMDLLLNPEKYTTPPQTEAPAETAATEVPIVTGAYG